jgi:ABC-2 type transport system ATP-binding protein
MANIIEVHNLVKKYGNFTAVDGISFNVEKGETFGILGPNGAGKTTTLEMVEGLKSITSGQVLLAGHDVSRQQRMVKSVIGVQLQASSFFDGLNLTELIETFASMYGRTVNAPELLGRVQLSDKAKNRAKELSGGQKQRLSIAVALVNDPKVIFLDEPTTGLDPQARRNLWDLVMDISRQGKTIVLTTHYMDEAEVLCDRIAIMDHAKIVKLDTTANLLKNTGVNSRVEFRTDKLLDVAALGRLPGVREVKERDNAYTLTVQNPEDALPLLFPMVHQAGVHLTGLQLKQPTLEDVFLKLTGHRLRE